MLQVCFRHRQSADNGSANGSGPRADEAHARAQLPALLPLARLGPRDTFGEAGTQLLPGVSYRSEGGASLLCWQRDAFLIEELSHLVGDSKDATP